METDAERHRAVLALAEGGLARAEDEAWAHFVEAWPIIERFVRVRLLTKRLHPGILEDCGQNVFTRVWLFRTTYRGSCEREFWAWLRTICDNESRRILARVQRAKALTETGGESDGTVDVADPADPSNVEVAKREAVQALRDCLARLPGRQKRVVELIYLRPQLSERAAAEALGWSASNVHKVKGAALRWLRDCLARNGIV